MIKTGKLSVKNKLLFFIVLCLTATSLFAEQQSTQDEKEQLKVGGYTPEYLFQSAIDNNVQLQLLNVEKSQSEIDVKNAKAKRFPSVDFQTTMSYLNNPLMDPITVTAGEYGSYELNGETILIPSEDIVLYEGMENTYYDFKFVIEQPIFTWGKINNAVHLYETISETKKFNIQKSKSEIRTKINIYSHTLFYLHKMEECLAQQQEHAHRLVTIAEESFQNGFILSADLLNAKISAKKIDVAVAELNEQKAQVFLELQHLSGLKKIDYDDFDFSFVKPIDAIEVSSQENYYKKAVEINPGLQMLTCLKDINELQVKIKKGYGYFKPDIGIHLELGYAGSRFPFIEKDWYGEDGIVFTSSLAFKSTLFDGGKVRNDINKSQEELNKALFQYQDGLNNLDQFISESILKLELNKRNIEYYRLKQENDKEQITLRKTQFDAGAGAEKDYLQEKINLNTDLINEYKETIDFYKNYFSLESVARAEE